MDKNMKDWEVMKAFEEGKKIQSKPAEQESGWNIDKYPNWDWHHYDYRVLSYE